MSTSVENEKLRKQLEHVVKMALNSPFKDRIFATGELHGWCQALRATGHGDLVDDVLYQLDEHKRGKKVAKTTSQFIRNRMHIRGRTEA